MCRQTYYAYMKCCHMEPHSTPWYCDSYQKKYICEVTNSKTPQFKDDVEIRQEYCTVCCDKQRAEKKKQEEEAELKGKYQEGMGAEK